MYLLYFSVLVLWQGLLWCQWDSGEAFKESVDAQWGKSCPRRSKWGNTYRLCLRAKAVLLLQTEGKEDTPCPSEPTAPLWSWRSNVSQPDWASQTPAGGSRGRNRHVQDLCLKDGVVKVVPGPGHLSLSCHSPGSVQGVCMPLGECHGPAASHPCSLLSQLDWGKKLQRKTSQALASPKSCKSSQAKTLGASENILQFRCGLPFTWPVGLLLQALLAALSLHFHHKPHWPQKNRGLQLSLLSSAWAFCSLTSALSDYSDCKFWGRKKQVCVSAADIRAPVWVDH